jgi:predicted ATPase/class 3 adenylate cyclase
LTEVGSQREAGVDVAELPSGTVTFLFTDIEGSTRLWEEHPDAMRDALACHDEIVREAIGSHDGHVFATGGDGFAAAFGRVGDALTAAHAAQASLGAATWPAGVRLRARMGVHTGEATERDGNYFGQAVNRAARLMAVAHGGQTVCSHSSAGIAGADVPVWSLGEHRLRDLTAPQEIFQVGPGVFPPLRSVDAVPTNLPIVRTELLGRTDDVAALCQLVGRERLVTLTGVGGVGKTRLALAVAASVGPGFVDGCWLVELAPVASADDVASAIAAAMRAPAADADALVAFLRDRRVLIVLDNCEHVLGAAAEVVDAALGAAPDVRVLVTSREPLGLDGEQVRRVKSLDVPAVDAPLAELQNAAAVRLFIERATAAAEGFRVDDDNAAAVGEICRHLDGIPLAIELAAARVRAMPPGEIARRLDERFRLLSAGSRRATERHRTLQATVSWSHELCSDDEQLVFRRLAVFPASFDLDAAEAVAGEDGQVDVVDCVLRLVDRSLVGFEPDTGRYRLLETLRQYGADRLADAGESESIRQRHTRHFLDLADRLALELFDARSPIAVAAITEEDDNLRAVAEWCAEHDDWEPLARMLDSFNAVGLMNVDAIVWAAWLEQVVDHLELLDPQTAVDVLGDLSYQLIAVSGATDAATALAERSVARADADGLQHSAWAWNSLATSALFDGRSDDALAAARRASDIAETRHQPWEAINSFNNQAFAFAAVGDLDRSATAASDALLRAEQTGSPELVDSAVAFTAARWLLMSVDPDFAAASELLGRHERPGAEGGPLAILEIYRGWTLLGLELPGAIERLTHAARVADRINSPSFVDLALRVLAVALADDGRTDAAAAIATYGDASLRRSRFPVPGQLWIQARLDEAFAGPAEHVLEAAKQKTWQRGEIMALIAEIELSLARGQAIDG